VGCGSEPRNDELAGAETVLNKPGRTEEVRKIAERFGVDPGTVQRIGEIHTACFQVFLEGLAG
jgi:hypothetical protein